MSTTTEPTAITWSGERLGRIIEDATNEVYLFSAETMRFVLVNRGARENLGYSMEELATRAPWDLKPDISESAFRAMLEPLQRGDAPFVEFETHHQRRDGSHYHVSVRLQLVGSGGVTIYYAAIQDMTERRRTERALAEVTRRLDAILNNTMMAVFMMDDQQQCVFMNRAAEELTGFSFGETHGRPLHDVIHHTRPDGSHFPLEECAIDRALPTRAQVQGEEVFVHKDGHFYPVAFTASPVHDDAGVAIGTVIEVREISDELRTREMESAFQATLQRKVAEALAERDLAERRFQQAQKMEALGKLTGGIAHDFNNLLQVIGGNLHMLAQDFAGTERAGRRVRNALKGVDRASQLSAQLLAFGRRQPLKPRVVNLGRILREMDDMLTRVLGEGIKVETVVGAGLWNCEVDTVQFENVVLNLAINARDAMQRQGKLTIEAGNAFLDDAYAEQHGVDAGQYVMLAVTDTGCGIAADIMDQVFDPFFSTKPEGEGSGLGLSMVFGFVKQSGGHVKIYSEPDEGTTVRIYMPRSRKAEDVTSPQAAAPVVGGTDTILVVEDDEEVRATAVEMLSDLGYGVLQAINADAALAVIESGSAIDMLFTDVVMPGKLTSPELARLARQRFPDIAVLFTSGYTQNAIVHEGRLDEGVELLSKPYSRDSLARKTRLLLDRRKAAAPDAAGDRPAPAPASSPLDILLVEDEALIRMVTTEFLLDRGHRVEEAANLTEAQALVGARRFHLIIADINLPDGSGETWARDMLARDPEVRVLLASGDAAPVGEQPDGRVARLSKPYDADHLYGAIAAFDFPTGGPETG